MLKPDKIRQIIALANPYLQRDPDKLQVFLDSGRIVA
ncbi:phage tail protein, partial [Photobacterium phosphoreum]|nr:phage tail protein [Photobacterium phosphoreum]